MQLRYVAGYIDANGNIIKGTGDFTVVHRTTGHYQIIFEPRFTNIISVIATQVYTPDGSTLDNAVIVNITNEQCYLHTGDAGGNNSDRQFCFIAVGAA